MCGKPVACKYKVYGLLESRPPVSTEIRTPLYSSASTFNTLPTVSVKIEPGIHTVIYPSDPRVMLAICHWWCTWSTLILLFFFRLQFHVHVWCFCVNLPARFAQARAQVCPFSFSSRLLFLPKFFRCLFFELLDLVPFFFFSSRIGCGFTMFPGYFMCAFRFPNTSLSLLCYTLRASFSMIHILTLYYPCLVFIFPMLDD